MNFSAAEVEKLKDLVSLCRQVGIEVVVVNTSKVLGANAARNLAIISSSNIQLGDAVIGIARVSELDKRLGLFEKAEAELKVTDRGEVSVITFTAGKNKAQFRCTSLALLQRKYPTENADSPFAAISLSKDEATQLSRAVKTFSSTKVVMKIDRSQSVRMECADSVNDVFTMDLSVPAVFEAEESTQVFTYPAANLCQIIDLAAKEFDSIEFVLGEAGSLTTTVRGHSLVIASSINEE